MVLGYFVIGYPIVFIDWKKGQIGFTGLLQHQKLFWKLIDKEIFKRHGSSVSNALYYSLYRKFTSF